MTILTSQKPSISIFKDIGLFRGALPYISPRFKTPESLFLTISPFPTHTQLQVLQSYPGYVYTKASLPPAQWTEKWDGACSPSATWEALASLSSNCWIMDTTTCFKYSNPFTAVISKMSCNNPIIAAANTLVLLSPVSSKCSHWIACDKTKLLPKRQARGGRGGETNWEICTRPPGVGEVSLDVYYDPSNPHMQASFRAGRGAAATRAKVKGTPLSSRYVKQGFGLCGFF